MQTSQIRTQPRSPMELFAFDYVARHKVGGKHLQCATVRQLLVLAPTQLERRAAWSSRHDRNVA